MAEACWQAVGLAGVIALVLVVGVAPSLALVLLAGRAPRAPKPD